MKLLVTGGAGFIGSNFVLEVLKSNLATSVTVYDSLTYAADAQLMNLLASTYSNFEFKHADVCNVFEVNDAVSKATHIVHFAAETHVTRSIADNDVFFQTDVLGTKNLVQAIVRNTNHIVKFIHISTSEVYGDATSDLMSENHALNPKSPYAAAKLGADRLVYAFAKTYGIPALIVRPFNQYGPRQHIEKVIPRFITAGLLNEPITLHGDGNSQRDYLHVMDLINFLKIALTSEIRTPDHVINVGSQKSISIIRIAELINNLFNNQLNFVFKEDRPGQVSRHAANSKMAHELFEWQPSIDFEEGLKDTVNWYKENRIFWEKQLWSKMVKITLPNGKEVEQ